MFQRTRLTLTAWYLVIIMTISILFSGVIYTSINHELDDFARLQAARQQRIRDTFGFVPVIPGDPTFDDSYVDNARNRVTLTLIFINVVIFFISGSAGYFLAGRTLKPIQEMIDEQGRFLSDASHELRTPLTSLRSEIEVGLRGKMLLTDARELLKSNLEEVIHLQKLSDNLLELTHYQPKNDKTIFSTLSLKDLIEDSVRSVSGLAKKKKISIINNITGGYVLGNNDKLRELFIILLDNATKYSKPSTTVTLNSHSYSKTIAVSVIDQGIGIPVTDIESIFERFYRGDPSRSKQTEGFGLGLSIAKQIVDIHQGTITVTSEVNKGSIFTVRLPIR